MDKNCIKKHSYTSCIFYINSTQGLVTAKRCTEETRDEINKIKSHVKKNHPKMIESIKNLENVLMFLNGHIKQIDISIDITNKLIQ